MKNTLVSALVLAATCVAAHSATINVGNLAAAPNQSRIFFDASGDSLGTGFVAVGYFQTLTSGQFATTTSAQFASDFSILGSASNSLTYTGFGPENAIEGIVSLSASASTPTGNPFVGKTAYVLVGNGSSLATSTQLFIMATGISIPADPSTPITIDMSAGTTPGTVQMGVDNHNGAVFIGNNNAGSITNGYRLATIFIPEPSTALLGAIGALGLLRRRR